MLKFFFPNFALRSRLVFKGVFTVLFTILLVISCKKDPDTAPTVDENSFSIDLHQNQLVSDRSFVPLEFVRTIANTFGPTSTGGQDKTCHPVSPTCTTYLGADPLGLGLGNGKIRWKRVGTSTSVHY
jgi:hypothetical protein